MKRILFYLNLLFFTVFFNTLNAQISNNEKQALTDLYNSTSGDDWTNSWNLNTSPKDWHGIIIKENHVVEVNLHKNNLQGVIPESIKYLKEIEVLDLGFNKITGDLPIEVVKLKELRVLNLQMNRLKGSIPQMIGRLTNLEELTLYNNMFEGPIPVSIGEVTKLKVLNLSSNFLNGGLPMSMERLSNLERLELFGNKLDGDIAIDLGKLKNLSQLVLAYNNFKGAVPSGLEKLNSLQFVQLQGNDFTSFESIQELNMDGLTNFDSDDMELNWKYNPLILNPKGSKTLDSKETRMADTKFENNN